MYCVCVCLSLRVCVYPRTCMSMCVCSCVCVHHLSSSNPDDTCAGNPALRVVAARGASLPEWASLSSTGTSWTQGTHSQKTLFIMPDHSCTAFMHGH